MTIPRSLFVQQNVDEPFPEFQKRASAALMLLTQKGWSFITPFTYRIDREDVPFGRMYAAAMPPANFTDEECTGIYFTYESEGGVKVQLGLRLVNFSSDGNGIRVDTLIYSIPQLASEN